ncbi:MAG: nucleotidyltransferase family protein [Planctomycetota bacterium]|jgi:DNA polymerase/3'-5' exonuclease PolX
MLLESAKVFAHRELERLEPHVIRAEIAGSIRREQRIVKDIEIVCIPKGDMFGHPHLPDGVFPDGSYKKDGDKYKQIQLENIKLDLFIVTPPASWGVIFTIRTGPPKFSQWVVTQRDKGGALPSHASVKNGAVWVGEEKLPMFEEIDFLDFIGLGWVEPSGRYPRMDLRNG